MEETLEDRRPRSQRSRVSGRFIDGRLKDPSVDRGVTEFTHRLDAIPAQRLS